MIDFTGVKAITIPEGSVKKITAGGKVLWEKVGYTNLVLTSTATPGGNEIYNGTGWKDNMRWSSSGKKETEGSWGRLTGWIPYRAGTLRIKNFGLNRDTVYGSGGYVYGGYLVCYYNDGTSLTHIFGWKDTDEATRELIVDPNCLYFRISGFYTYKNNTTSVVPDPIVTIDEEIEL